MKKFRLISLIAVICLLLAVMAPSAAALEEPSLVAKEVILVDLDSGRTLYAKNEHAQTSPASLTKIMTALLAIEAVDRGEHTWDEMVTAGADCRQGMDESSSTAGIMPGETMSYKDLVYCAMLPSANEACNILGTCISGSISAFVELMNQRAQELGCENTHFMNPNGLTADGHYSTAYDMYLMTRAAISHPDFMEICNTINYTVPATNMAQERKLANSNALISENSIYNTEGNYYLYDGAAGVKTGYTRAAGYCLISTAQRNGINVLAVVMGSTGVLNSDRSDYGNFEDSVNLYDWAFGSFSYQEVVSSASTVQTVEVALAEDSGKVSLHPQESISLLLANDFDLNNVSLMPTIYEDRLVAPIAAGDVLGEAIVYVDGENFGTIRLVSDREVELSRSEYIRQKLDETFNKTWVKVLIVVVLILLLCYAALVAHYRKLRRKHLKARRQAEQRRRMERERYYQEMDRRNRPEPTQRFSAVDPSKRPDDSRRYQDYFSDDR